jgi:hypothetical protein
MLTPFLFYPFFALSVYLFQCPWGPASHGRNRSRDAAVRRIRILLAGMPRMLLDMVGAILMAHPEMIVFGKTQDTADIRAAAKNVRADVVILSEPAGRAAPDYRELLYSHPHLKVLSITSDGQRFFLHELRPFHAPLGEISPESLVRAIRSSVQQRLG